eukprot:2343737-Prymnesium_polylepis.2
MRARAAADPSNSAQKCALLPIWCVYGWYTQSQRPNASLVYAPEPHSNHALGSFGRDHETC